MKKAFLFILIPALIISCKKSDSEPDNKRQSQGVLKFGSDFPSIKKAATEYANIVYIDPSVASSGSGTEGSPYKSIDEITLESNTAYLFKKGTSDFLTFKSVTKNNILFGAYGSGDARPIISSGEEEVNKLFAINGDSIVFDGLEIITMAQKVIVGEYADKRSGKVEVHDCSIHGISEEQGAQGFVIADLGPYSKVMNCEIYFCHLEPMSGFSDYFEIAYNEMYDLALSALDDPEADFNGADVMQFTNGIHGFHIHNNYIDGRNVNRKYAIIYTRDDSGEFDNIHGLIENNHIIMSNNRPVFHIDNGKESLLNYQK
jgi:hypothetical protein